MDIKCEHCGQILDVNDEMFGRELTCPRCNSVFVYDHFVLLKEIANRDQKIEGFQHDILVKDGQISELREQVKSWQNVSTKARKIVVSAPRQQQPSQIVIQEKKKEASGCASCLLGLFPVFGWLIAAIVGGWGCFIRSVLWSVAWVIIGGIIAIAVNVAV